MFLFIYAIKAINVNKHSIYINNTFLNDCNTKLKIDDIIIKYWKDKKKICFKNITKYELGILKRRIGQQENIFRSWGREKKVMKIIQQLILSKHNKGKCKCGLNKVTGADFLTLIFSEQWWATLDVSNDKIKCYVVHGNSPNAT